MRSGTSVVRVGWQRGGWLVLSLLACLCLAPASAAATSYHVFLCEIPYGVDAGSPASTEDVSYSTKGTYSEGGSFCEAPDGVMVARMNGAVEHSADEEGEAARFTAPDGLSIAGFTLWRYEQIGNTQSYGPPVTSIDYGNASSQIAVAACSWISGCSANGIKSVPLSSKNEVSAVSLNGMTYIEWSAVCAATGGTCPAGPSSEEDVYAADIDLVDDTPPTVSDVSGPLIAGGTLSGKQTVSFDASDGQSGVYGGSLVVDGHTIVSQILDTDEGHCQSLGLTNDGQRSFDHVQPCPPSLSASLTLNTGTLAPGTHSLELIVEDAAGNQAIAYDGTIMVAGPPPTGAAASATGPIGPGSPLALRGPANGTNASDQAKLTARWTSTTKTTRTTPYGATNHITGHLTTSTGQPISGAMLDITEDPAVQGARVAALAGVRTGPTGAWTLTLPKTIPSITLRIIYRSHVNDTVPVATATLTLRVHAGIALHITPHTTSVNHTIHFSGSLHGTPIPPGGKQLVLEASSGGEWIQFDTLATGAHGRYHASYRFKFPGPVTYKFRVISPHEADFPFLAGSSNVVAVYER